MKRKRNDVIEVWHSTDEFWPPALGTYWVRWHQRECLAMWHGGGMWIIGNEIVQDVEEWRDAIHDSAE